MNHSSLAMEHARFDSIRVGGRALFRYLVESVSTSTEPVADTDLEQLGRIAVADAAARCSHKFAGGSRVYSRVKPDVRCTRRLSVSGPLYTVDVEVRGCFIEETYEMLPMPAVPVHIVASEDQKPPEWDRLLMLAQSVGNADIFDPNAVVDFVERAQHPESALWIRRLQPFRDDPDRWAVFLASYVFNLMSPTNRSALGV